MKISNVTFKNNNNKIELLDALMGSGKTQCIINWMNIHTENRYLYVSPLLSETEGRIPDNCLSLDFKTPNLDEFNTKADHLLHLLKAGHNIAITHALFIDLTVKHLIAIDNKDYTLIIDEEIDFVYNYSGKYGKDDIETLVNSGKISIDYDNLGKVNWSWDEDEFKSGSVYTRLKNLAELEMIYVAKRSHNMMVVQLPISLVKVVKRCIVLTYMFDGSIMDTFMRMRGLEISKFNDVVLSRTDHVIKQQAKSLITLFSTDSVKKVNRLGLSTNWYEKNSDKTVWTRLENAIRSACRKGCVEDVMYTMHKNTVIKKNSKAVIKMRIRGYSPETCFVGCSSRATNDYAHKNVLVHAYNRYPNAKIISYLQDYNFIVDTDRFALSEMLQWIWRSQIRKDKPIQLCIISDRMRGLFVDWLC